MQNLNAPNLIIKQGKVDRVNLPLRLTPARRLVILSNPTANVLMVKMQMYVVFIRCLEVRVGTLGVPWHW